MYGPPPDCSQSRFGIPKLSVRTASRHVLWNAMKPTQLRWLLLGLLAFWFALMAIFSGPKTIGLSSETVNGEYRFAGGTDPAALGFAVVMMVGYLLLVNGEQPESRTPLCGVFRRFVAFWLDIMFASLTVGPVLGLVPTIVEWRRTGVFQWSFERSTSETGDTFQVFVLMLLMLSAFILYFVIPLRRHRPSPGACIMGYCVVPDDGASLTLRQASLRTLLGFIAACTAYLAPFVARDRKQGKFWLDRVFGTRAIRLH